MENKQTGDYIGNLKDDKQTPTQVMVKIPNFLPVYSKLVKVCLSLKSYKTYLASHQFNITPNSKFHLQ